MNKHKIFMIFLIVSLSLGMFSSLFHFSIKPVNATAGQSTVAQIPNADGQLGLPSQKKTLWIPSVSRWFTFIVSSNGNDFGYKTSTDGVTWSSFTNVKKEVAWPDGYDVWFSDSLNKISLTTIGGSQHLYYRQGTPETNGSISWDSNWITVNNQWDLYFPHVVRDSNNYIWISYELTNYGLGSYDLYVVNSTDTLGSAWNSPVMLWSDNIPSSYADVISVVPLDNGKMFAIATQYVGHLIWSRYYDGHVWGTSVITLFSIAYAFSFDAVSDGTNVHLVWLEYSTNDVCYAEWSSDVWGSRELVEAGVSVPSSPFVPSITLLDFDYIRIFYVESTNSVAYRDRDIGSWQAIGWVTQSTYGVSSVCSSYSADDSKYSVIWDYSPYGAGTKYVVFQEYPLPTSVCYASFSSNIDDNFDILALGITVNGTTDYTPFTNTAIIVQETTGIWNVNVSDPVFGYMDGVVYHFIGFLINGSAYNYSNPMALTFSGNLTIEAMYGTAVSTIFSVHPSFISSTLIVNGSSYSYQHTFNAFNNITYQFNTSSFVMYEGINYTFAQWFVNGSFFSSTNSQTIFFNGNTTVDAYYTLSPSTNFTLDFKSNPLFSFPIQISVDGNGYSVPSTHIFNATTHTIQLVPPYGNLTVGSSFYLFSVWNIQNITGSFNISSQTIHYLVGSNATLTAIYHLFVPPVHPTYPNTIYTDPGWQFIYGWDFVGFIIYCWTASLGESAFVLWAMAIVGAIYIRTRNLSAMVAMWFLLGSTFIIFIPAASPLIYLLFVFGIAGVMYKVFQWSS
jgi:hypothetical protein